MIFIDACFKKPTPYTPVWMMRQAGRYLPEYMSVRQSVSGFLELCKDYKKACEVTLQPVEILGVDAAILFSDILVVPLEMGMELKFVPNIGPIFSKPIASKDDLTALDSQKAIKNLGYVYDTIKLSREKLAPDKALIGFCGAPWTIATYMIEGKGSKTYNLCKKLVYQNPQFLNEILAKITAILKEYLQMQIRCGVNAVMVFDSWAGALEMGAYLEFGLKYINEIVDFIKSKYPHIAVIVFPKGTGGFLDKMSGNFDVFGVDWSTPISTAKQILSPKYTLQGNMEPHRLYSQSATSEGIDEILSVMQNSPHIFNLGHGILPDIPVQNAKYFVKQVQIRSKR